MHRLATVHARDNQRRHDTAYLNKRLFYESKVRRLKNYDNMLSHFHLIPERHGRTDGWTALLYQYRVSVC